MINVRGEVQVSTFDITRPAFPAPYSLCQMLRPPAISNRDKHFIILIGIDENDDGYIYVKDPYPEKPEKIEIKSFLRNNQPIMNLWDVIDYVD